MMGYLLDEDDFVVTPAVNRSINFYEISENLYRASYQVDSDEEKKTICISVLFQRGVNNVTIPIEVDATYNSITATNSSSEIIMVNGSVVTPPFSVVNGDSLYIKVNKSDANISSEIELSGTIS
jgi:hypothetical protein